MREKDGILVCFFESGEINTVSPSGSRLRLSIDSGYPFGDGRVGIVIGADRKENFRLSLRIPHRVGRKDNRMR